MRTKFICYVIIGLFPLIFINLASSDTDFAKQIREKITRVYNKSIDDAKGKSFCVIGSRGDSIGIIRAISDYAYKQGLRINDKIEKVNSIEVKTDKEISDLVRAAKPTDAINITVRRSGIINEVLVQCRDSRDRSDRMIDMLKAGADGDWQKCIQISYEIENTWEKPSFLAFIRLDCKLAENFQSKRKPDIGTAEMAYEARRRKILETFWANGDLDSIKADVIKTISFLERDNFYNFAAELKNLWNEKTDKMANKPNNQFPEEPEPKKVTGTCFAVSPDGHIITAHHIIDGFTTLKIKLSGDENIYDAKVLKVSRSNDIALLKINIKTSNWLQMISTKKINTGTPIFTIGYPVHLLLGSEPKFTEGSVSSMSGLTGEDAFMQISVPIQPGNSGGPVVTFGGSVIGIVTSTAAIKPFLSFTGSLPQNINWAIKADYAMILFDQPQKSNILNTREKAINTVKDSICFIEATKK